MRLEITRIRAKSKLFRVPSKPRLTFDVVLPLGNHHGPAQLSQVRLHNKCLTVLMSCDSIKTA